MWWQVAPGQGHRAEARKHWLQMQVLRAGGECGRLLAQGPHPDPGQLCGLALLTSCREEQGAVQVAGCQPLPLQGQKTRQKHHRGALLRLQSLPRAHDNPHPGSGPRWTSGEADTGTGPGTQGRAEGVGEGLSLTRAELTRSLWGCPSP